MTHTKTSSRALLARTAALSLLLALGLGQARSVTVKAGDTAYRIATDHGLTVQQLLDINDLDSHDLQVGQVLEVGEEARSDPAQADSDSLTHLVGKGDTIYSLARTYDVTPQALIATNRLAANALIKVGQTLLIPGGKVQLASTPATTPAKPAEAAPSTSAPATPAGQASVVTVEKPAASAPNPAYSNPLNLPEGLLKRAMAYLGTPYLWGGNTASGIDCSGFTVQVFRAIGVRLPRQSWAQARVGQQVSPQQLAAGDLVFFDTIGKGSITHVGIYIGQDRFINANSYRGKVVVDTLMGDRYWAQRFVGARRVSQLATTASDQASSEAEG